MSVRLFKSLMFKVSHLQQQIEHEHTRPAPNWLRLLKLKKLRLVIKDRINRLVYHAMAPQLRTVPIRHTR